MPLSVQEVIDCGGSAGGCSGGAASNDQVFQEVIKLGGLAAAAAYPYNPSPNPGACKKVPPTAVLESYTDIAPNSDAAMMTALATQPVAAFVEADQSSFQFYESGVLTAACGADVDLAVLVVGYGSEAGTDFYKVKNSWGAGWGDKGYIYLARGAQYNGGAGQCGVLAGPSVPNM